MSYESSLVFQRKRALSYFQTTRSQGVFSCATKHGLLLTFDGDECATYLAHLADIFEANQLNKKLQGLGSNIILHTDAINALPYQRKTSNFGSNEQ